MAESQLRIVETARSGASAQMRVACRILEHTTLYRRWEAEHGSLMRKVSVEEHWPAQVIALRLVTFGLRHRKAMFEYLRDRHVTGGKRQRLLALFYGPRDTVNSMLAEHGNYLRCTSSFVCSCYLAERLLRAWVLCDNCLPPAPTLE